MTAGKVCTGFSKPYVAWLQDSNNGSGIYSISGGRKLAQGVSVSVDIDSSNDNNFFANNGGSESSQTLFFGGTLTLVHIFGIYFTGTSVNPARSFGPALFVGGDALSNVWVFIVAPLVGGVLAALVYSFLAGKKENK